MMFAPVTLEEDGKEGRPLWSAQVNLPAEIDAEVRRYVEEDAPTSWTVVIHSALYAYRRQFWTREQLRAEFVSAIEEGQRSIQEGKSTLVTPAFWKEFEAKSKRKLREIKALTQAGKLGNLLLPKELYDFVNERTAAEGHTATEVICAALPYFKAERDRMSDTGQHKTVG